jgi:hypothetical protein
MAEVVDPFTRAYQAVWTALNAHAGFTDLVRVNNRNDLTGAAPGTRKGAGQFADFGEVSLVPAGFNASPFGSNSKIADVSQSFQLITSTERITDLVKLNKIKFQTMIALAKAGADLGLTGLCREWNVSGGQDGVGAGIVAGIDVTHGKNGLVSLLTIDVQMYMNRAELVAL